MAQSNVKSNVIMCCLKKTGKRGGDPIKLSLKGRRQFVAPIYLDYHEGGCDGTAKANGEPCCKESQIGRFLLELARKGDIDSLRLNIKRLIPSLSGSGLFATGEYGYMPERFKERLRDAHAAERSRVPAEALANHLGAGRRDDGVCSTLLHAAVAGNQVTADVQYMQWTCIILN